MGQEPHLRGRPLQPDPSEERADRTLAHGQRPDQGVEHTIWDEPALSPLLAGAVPPGELTYRRWLLERRDRTTAARSWAITIGAAAAAGPWAVLGAFWGSGRTVFSVAALIAFAPLVEEMMKAALALYVVEKKPFLFRSRAQIGLCVVAGAFAFAVLENLLYLNVYIPKPPVALVRWRWSVCVALHMGCSLIASMGLMRVWTDTWRRLDRPRLALAYPYVLTAVVVHGTYNALALLLTVAGFTF